jgi:tRNA splicing ligase
MLVMKRSMIVLLAGALMICLALGCSKQTVFSTSEAQLYGSWNWVQTDGGIANNIHETPVSTGKNIILEFRNNNTCVITINGRVTGSGSYRLKTVTSIYDGKEKQLIVFADLQENLILSVTSSRLTLADNAYDGLTSIYQKSGKP